MIKIEKRSSQKHGTRSYVRVVRSVRTENGPRHKEIENFGFEPEDPRERADFWGRVHAREDQLKRDVAQEKAEKKKKRKEAANSAPKG